MNNGINDVVIDPTPTPPAPTPPAPAPSPDPSAIHQDILNVLNFITGILKVVPGQFGKVATSIVSVLTYLMNQPWFMQMLTVILSAIHNGGTPATEAEIKAAIAAGVVSVNVSK